MRVCQNPSCGNKLNTRQKKFCSYSCAYAARQYLPKKTREEKNAYMAAYMLKRYHRRRAAAIELLGGKCVRCGTTGNLELDHIDRSQKAFTTGAAFATWSEERVQAEVAKCQLLCKDCHLEKSKSECFGKEPARHGTPHMYGRYKCRCDACVEARRQYDRDYSRRKREKEKSRSIG